MGGRAALHFAIRYPERVRTLILESASPGIEDDDERQRRATSDAQLAQRILRDGVPAFVGEWERQQLLALRPHVSDVLRARQHAQRLINSPVGLANSLRGMGTGQQTPLWSRLLELQRPVQLIVGERDTRYHAIAQRMRAALLLSDLAVVPDAGHTVHIDQSRQFVILVENAIDNKLTQPVTRC
jgi:2-succinyl-6-hydroxy-2,4-cyclohexadiene-1-carboxylate synthase